MQNIANEEGVTEWKDISFVSNTYLPYPDLNVGSYFIKVDKFTEALTKHIKTIKKDFTYDKSASYNSTFDFISADGTTWFFDCALYISVDVNGQKGPNEYGRDIFVFEINVDRNRIEPNGAKTYKDFTTGKWVVDDYWKNCSAVSIGMHCTAKVLIEGKMNY